MPVIKTYFPQPLHNSRAYCLLTSRLTGTQSRWTFARPLAAGERPPNAAFIDGDNVSLKVRVAHHSPIPRIASHTSASSYVKLIC